MQRSLVSFLLHRNHTIAARGVTVSEIGGRCSENNGLTLSSIRIGAPPAGLLIFQ
jgi:hypothetical protein